MQLDSIKQSLHKKIPKKILKRNLTDVGMSQSMNALADKVRKQEVPCTHWYARALHNMATLFNNHASLHKYFFHALRHPYISKISF